jgi:hypothetical protein
MDRTAVHSWRSLLFDLRQENGMAEGETAAAQAVAQIESMQRDGLLLLAYLAQKPDRWLIPGAQPGESQVDAGLLTAPAAAIEADPAKLNGLVQSLDWLGRAAAPATITSVRLTSAYLYGPSPQNSAAEVARAQHLRRWMNGIRLVLLVAVVLAVALLMHVDDGRRIVGQLATVRTDLDKSFGDLAKLDRNVDFEPLLYYARPDQPKPPMPALSSLDPCWPTEPETAPATPPAPEYRVVPVKPQAQNLCSLLYQQQLREAMVYARLAAWNCRMLLMNPLNLVRAPFTQICDEAPADLSPPARRADWKRTELRTNDGITRLTGYILPLLLGGVGGCVYVLRRQDDTLRSWTLSANDGVASFGRVILASTFGGLLGLVFGTDGPVQLGGFSLSLAAWAFFLGYSLESVLKALDALIEGLVAKLRPASEKQSVPMAPTP